MTTVQHKTTTNRSLAKAVRVLKLFSAQEPRLSLVEISARLKMPKSTTHAILRSLVTEGLIEKISSEAYALGTGILSMSQSVRVNVEVRDRAAPHVRALADEVGESVYLTFFEGDHILYIYAVETSRRLIARTAVGDRMPMHSTGAGKAILAQLPPDEAVAILKRVGMPKVTPNTITDIDTLTTELAEIRERGYSFDNSENEPGIYCIGAPLFGFQSVVVGSVSIASTDPEVIGARATDIARLLLSTCLDISRNLGYVPLSFAQLTAAAR